jgi:AraC-like DNA-binding protein
MFAVGYDIGGTGDSLAETFSRYLPSARIDRFESPGDFQWSGLLAARDGRGLWRMRSNADWEFASSANIDRSVFLSLPERGGLKVIDKQRELVAGPGQAIVLHTPGNRANVAFCAGDHARTSLKWRVTEASYALSSSNEHIDLDDIAILPVIDLTDERGAVIRSLIDAIAIDLASPEPASPLASALMNEALLRLLFEPTLDRLRRTRCRPQVLPRHVKQAIEFMQANAGEPLRIRDIADACCVTPRTLENGFKTFKSMTPVAYLRKIRLAAVRRELTSVEFPARITAIAHRWGFSDLGRFAESYRREFGELPSETMRRDIPNKRQR